MHIHTSSFSHFLDHIFCKYDICIKNDTLNSLNQFDSFQSFLSFIDKELPQILKYKLKKTLSETDLNTICKCLIQKLNIFDLLDSNLQLNASQIVLPYKQYKGSYTETFPLPKTEVAIDVSSPILIDTTLDTSNVFYFTTLKNAKSDFQMAFGNKECSPNTLSESKHTLEYKLLFKSGNQEFVFSVYDWKTQPHNDLHIGTLTENENINKAFVKAIKNKLLKQKNTITKQLQNTCDCCHNEPSLY